MEKKTTATKGEAEQRVDRAVAVLNGFWRRRDDAKRDIPRYGELANDYPIIVGSERTTAGELVFDLKKAIHDSEAEECDALRELVTALDAAGEREEVAWAPPDALDSVAQIDPYALAVSRCGPLGWRMNVTMTTTPSRGIVLATVAGFVSMIEARRCAEAYVYAHRRK